MAFENFKKIILGAGAVAAVGSAKAHEKSPEKITTDSTISKQIEDPVNGPLKPGEKFRIIRETKQFDGLTLDGKLLLPIMSDTTKEFYIVKFSGEGKNMIGKELEALKSMGLTPAPEKYLSEINPEAFKAAGSSVKAIDITKREAENLGQGAHALVKENDVVTVRNALNQINSMEIKAMEAVGGITDYATIAYKNKDKSTTANYSDGLTSNKK